MAVPKTLSISLHEMSKALADRPDIILKWVQYREHWWHLMKFIYERPPNVLHRGGIAECDLWAPFHQRVLLKVGADIGKVQQFDDILKKDGEEDLDSCSHCQTRVRNWRFAFERRLGEIPSFDADVIY